MKFIKPLIISFFYCCAINFVNAQQVGDFRSISSGNWTTVSTWQTYNGTAWAAAIYYPGQISGTNDCSYSGRK